MNPPSDPARRGPYYGLLALTGLFTVAAVLTLIPFSDASWPNIWGYKSLCTFTPGATLACALLAGLCCTVRNRLVRADQSSPLPALVVLLVLGALLTWATLAWAEVKDRYADAQTSASVQ